MRFTVLIVSLLVLGSCESDTDPTVLTGNLTGRVILFSQGEYVDDRSGVLVSVEGTDRSATSDEDGKWTITDLPTGTYVITFSKPGYGEEKQFGHQFIGGGTSYINSPVSLSDAPVSRVSLDSFFFTYTYTLMVNITGTAPQPNTERMLIVCFSRDSTRLLGDPADADMVLHVAINVSDTNTVFSEENRLNYPVTQDYFDTLSPGTILFATVRIVGEGKSFTSFSSYYDPTRYRSVHTAAGPISQILKDTIS